MNIESIKEIMDGFDPAALLPELDSVVGKVELITRLAVMAGPVIMLVLGLLYFFVAPKEANYHFGYRCWFGMGSVQAWQFTQKIAGLAWTGLGFVLTVVMFFISLGYRGMEPMTMVENAAVGMIWEIGLVALVCIGVNVFVAVLFDKQGDRRKK